MQNSNCLRTKCPDSVVPKNQLTPADIGPEFANLVEIKHMGHVFRSVLGPELEFEVKNIFFQKQATLPKFYQISKF